MSKIMNKKEGPAFWAVVWGALLLLGTTAPAKAQTPADEKGNAPVTSPAAEPTPAAAPATAPSGKGKELTGLSLENLMGLNVQVTSSAKKAESLRDATSAIFVITGDDIRRSGARHLADLLAMVPGVQVARQSASEWAISSRGFNSFYNNKMLLLVDGRSVYDPVQGAINWSEQDVMLEDIDHIEVIRGPGGTLWGANAVNGIINVITKDSKITQGLYASAQGGLPLYDDSVNPYTAMEGQGAVRYGGKINDDLYYRVFGQATNREPTETLVPGGFHDAWYDFRAGFRTDLHAGQDQVLLEAEGQKGYFDYVREAATSYFNPYTMAPFVDVNTTLDQNAHVLGKWSRSFEDNSEIQLLAYYDYINLTKTNDGRITNVGTADVEFQHRFGLGSWNEVTYGGSFRNISDQFYNQINYYYLQPNQNLNIYGGFLQDKLTLVDDRLFLTGGAKLENNTYTGDEWQPSGRLLWTPDETNSVWAAVSRAVRIPQQTAETVDIFLNGVPAGAFGPGNPPENLYAVFTPNTHLISETLVAYELGYRTNLTKETSLDLASFYNHYEHLYTFSTAQYAVPTGTTPLGGALIALSTQQNGGGGDVYGVEVSAKWEPSKDFHAALGYTYQNYDQAMINSANLQLGAVPPHNLINGRVTYAPVDGWELNANAYYSDWTPLYDPSSPTSLPDYMRIDVGTTLKATDNLEASLWAMDLEGAHTETFPGFGIVQTEVVPSAYAQVTVRY